MPKSKTTEPAREGLHAEICRVTAQATLDACTRPKPNGYAPLVNAFQGYCGGQLQEPYANQPNSKVALAVALVLKALDVNPPTTAKAAVEKAIAAVGGDRSCVGRILAAEWGKLR